MSEDQVTIEVDGRALTARKGAMLIDVTDTAGIYIPRFCYHKKLTVAANCRMCLVEVERAPKPQPACATPVMDGMKVFTKSAKAVAAQQATMEFLLINHPLDCPICDQGGECELQDLALGYGTSVSQYSERKRVVRDKNIGPLVQTDMTRCIHCTRCVRFGEEIAGLRELGATGRGEYLEIGTYVAQTMTSELSGNVIDLCPVGALTSKPYRYSARAWELQQYDSIAPHDCIGSNVHVHAKGQTVKRIVPKENEQVNETWLADRDRFSYEALRSESRLLTPRIKQAGAWQDCDWDTAFKHLRDKITVAGAKNSLAALASPASTCEEFFLLQRLCRGLGSQNIDHRLRQTDFSGAENDPLFPSLGVGLDELEHADTVLLVGGYPRHDQPLLNHRLRKAVNRGAKVLVLDAVAFDYNFEVTLRLNLAPSGWVEALCGVIKAHADLKQIAQADLAGVEPTSGQREFADLLRKSQRAVLLAGNRVQSHAERGTLLSLLGRLAADVQGRAGQLTEGANAAGAWLAGALPHRGPAGRLVAAAGKTAADLLREPVTAYLLLGIEPDRDCAIPARAVATLDVADFVAAMVAFTSPVLERVADLLLPVAVFPENEGSFINAAAEWQTFASAVKPPGSARPAWKVLRALGELCALPGFDAVTCADVTAELAALCGPLTRPGLSADTKTLSISRVPHGSGLEPVIQVPMYGADALVRRASALQQMPQVGDDLVHLSGASLAALGVTDGGALTLSAEGVTVRATAKLAEEVADGCCFLYSGTELTAALPTITAISVARAG